MKQLLKPWPHSPNILIGFVEEKDKELFFGPLAEDDGEFITLPLETTYPQVLKQAGVFPSTSQARQNGWDKEVPEGFTIVKVGKGLKYREAYILKRKTPLALGSRGCLD